MEGDSAGQLERFIAAVDKHPLIAAAVLIGILLILAFKKDGVLPKYLDLLTERARLDTAKEERRLEMVRMVESRPQANIPGLEER